jgi:hypothetical protein
MDEPVTTVATFSTPVEAELARNRLEEKGIAASVADAETAGMLFALGGALGGVKVQVAESDAARARAVLASREGRSALSDNDDYGLEERVKAGRRARLRHSPVKADEEDEDEPVESDADAIAARAWRSAVIGLLMLPPLLHFYSAWLLFQLPWARGVLSHAGRRNVVLAAVLDLLVLAALLLLLRSLVVPPAPRPARFPGPPFEKQEPVVPIPKF